MRETKNESNTSEDTFASNLKRWRIAKGMTQEALNNAMVERGFDFHPTTIYRIETGRRRVLIGEGIALAAVLDVPLEVLAGNDENSEAELLTKMRLGAESMLFFMKNASNELSEARLRCQIYIEANLKKMEKLGVSESKSYFGEKETTAAAYYAPFLQAKEELQAQKSKLDEITERLKGLVS
jgi:transcriptional regulator with XRE-family HTH domain